jgi:hypothetical protein
LPLCYREFGSIHVQTVTLKGVENAYNDHGKDAEPKGIKAHFRMDDSGLLSLDKVGYFILITTEVNNCSVLTHSCLFLTSS